jgi:Putative serine esterase (DUF676)
MRKFYLRVICFFIFFYSIGASAGGLVYREGDANPSCIITKNYPMKEGPRAGAVQDKTRTTHTLTCDGQFVSAVTIPSPVCSPRGGGVCSMPAFVTCLRSCVSHMTRLNDTVNYDFNYQLPGVAAKVDNLNVSEFLFGTVSKKSSANVFAERALSSNYIAYSNDGILDKPIILVEGYDPDNNIFPNFYREFNRLVYGGRDLIIVNFPNGSGDMNENAALVQNIIQEVNNSKSGNYPIAVIGFSMGGIIARKALKDMELRGINHQTSLYVSYDSPHLGANAPLAIQNTVDDIVGRLDKYTAGYTTSALKRAQNVYKSSAAREMLISGSNFKNATAADFPNNLTRIAVTSGSLNGVNALQTESVYEGEYTSGFRFYLYDNWWGHLSVGAEWYSAKQGNYYYDNAPGSYDQAYRRAYLELKDGADSFEVWNEAKNQNITFIPTISSLAISVPPTTYLKDIFRYKSPFDKYIAVDESGADACTVFAAQTATGKNIPHSPGYFDGNQLAQLACALDSYHQVGVAPPDRSFKQY